MKLCTWNINELKGNEANRGSDFDQMSILTGIHGKFRRVGIGEQSIYIYAISLSKRIHIPESGSSQEHLLQRYVSRKCLAEIYKSKYALEAA